MRPLPPVVVNQPDDRDSAGSRSRCIGSISCLLCSCFHRGSADVELELVGHVAVSKKRGKWLKGNVAEEQEAIALLKVENHYLQE